MTVTRPEWFEDFGVWWDSAVDEGVARHVEPVGIDDQARLHVHCSSPAWKTQIRLLGPRLISRINTALAPDLTLKGMVAQVADCSIPQVIRERWPDVVGEDFADQIEPDMVGNRGQRLYTGAVSAEARDEAVRRAPESLARIRELVSTTTITSWAVSLLPAKVLIDGSADISDRQAVEEVLLQIWHDAVQALGTEQPLAMEPCKGSGIERFVNEWAEQASLPVPSGTEAVLLPPTLGTAPDADQALQDRNQETGERRPDLCVTIIRHADEVLALETKARAAGIPVQRVLLPGA